MRLKADHEATIRPTTTRRREYRGEFTWVMTIIVDQQHGALVERDFAPAMETTPHALEVLQRVRDRLGFHAKLPADGGSSQCVEYVVATRQVELDVQRLVATWQPQLEMH